MTSHSTEMELDRWIKWGYNFLLFGALVLCWSRALAYSGFLFPPHETANVFFLTSGGHYLWIFVLAWFLIGCLVLYEMGTKTLNYSLPILGVMLIVWGVSYIPAWEFGNLMDYTWMTITLYISTGVIVIGSYIALYILKLSMTILRMGNAKLAERNGHLECKVNQLEDKQTGKPPTVVLTTVPVASGKEETLYMANE